MPVLYRSASFRLASLRCHRKTTMIRQFHKSVSHRLVATGWTLSLICARAEHFELAVVDID
jgi:hypothetical protein